MGDGVSHDEPTAAKVTGADLTYHAVVAYLVAKGWRRQELGSGWWWRDGMEEDAGLGGALEQQLRADGVEMRDAIPGEPEEFWG